MRTVFLLFVVFSAFSLPASTQDNVVSIRLNGHRLVERGIILGGTTYLPLRALVEALGGTVEFDRVWREVTVIAPQDSSSMVSRARGMAQLGRTGDFMDTGAEIDSFAKSVRSALLSYRLYVNSNEKLTAPQKTSALNSGDIVYGLLEDVRKNPYSMLNSVTLNTALRGLCEIVRLVDMSGSDYAFSDLTESFETLSGKMQAHTMQLAAFFDGSP